MPGFVLPLPMFWFRLLFPTFVLRLALLMLLVFRFPVLMFPVFTLLRLPGLMFTVLPLTFVLRL